MADEASRPVLGGNAQPVFIVNQSVPTTPGSTPPGTQNVALVSSPTGASATQVQGPVAHDSPVVGNPILNGAYASDTPPANVTLADIVRLWAKLNGALSVFNAYALNSIDDAVQAYPPSTAVTVASTAYENDRVLKAAPGTLVSLTVYNSKVSAQFIQIHNVAATPADAVAPLLTQTVAASSNLTINFPLAGLPCTTGIYVCNSSTGPTKTLALDDCYFTAVVI